MGSLPPPLLLPPKWFNSAIIFSPLANTLKCGKPKYALEKDSVDEFSFVSILRLRCKKIIRNFVNKAF